MLRRLPRLTGEAQRTPFEGTGKPEPLRRNLPGFWSRRIDDEHRLVHGVTDDELIIIQAR
ncbi:MAG TPA: Txe/YoeB family addiction module toxin [Streptosporangiaceae bacterium]|nr:Txe/YoeB family addiction module toxin [Streptosporangiaceae bacterium]